MTHTVWLKWNIRARKVVVKAKQSDWLEAFSAALGCSLLLLYSGFTEQLCCLQNNKYHRCCSTGNAGFRLHFPAHFELVGDLEVRRQSEEEQNGMAHLPRQQPLVQSVEACIGQKLQLIGDQFHREHLQLVRRKAESCWLCKHKKTHTHAHIQSLLVW